MGTPVWTSLGPSRPGWVVEGEAQARREAGEVLWEGALKEGACQDPGLEFSPWPLCQVFGVWKWQPAVGRRWSEWFGVTGALAAAFAPSTLACDVLWPGVIGPHSRGRGGPFQEGKGMLRQCWTWWVQGLAVCFNGRQHGEWAQGDGKHASRQEGPGRCGQSRRMPLLKGEPAGRGWKPSAHWLLG